MFGQSLTPALGQSDQAGHERRTAVLRAEQTASARTDAEARLEIWRLQMGDRVMTCELRDDDRAGAGFDVQLLEGGELRASRRCVDVKGARFVAESYRQDLLRTEWTE